MVETRWNKMFLLLMLVLQFSGALTRQLDLFSTVRDGDKATLSCENVMDDHHNCDKTTWVFSNSKIPLAVELVTLGQIKNKTNKDRLNVTANCSLVIKKVTVEDAGHYSCRQYISEKEFQDAWVDLSVVTVTEHKDTDLVTLNCSVTTNRQCRHTVKWLFKGQAVDNDNPNIKTSQSSCSVTVSFVNNFWGSSIPYHDWFKCSVSTETKKEPLTFSLRPSGEDTKTTTTTTANNTKGDTTTTGSSFSDTPNLWWLYIVVPVVAVALLIIAVKVTRSRRTKGKNTQRNGNVALTSDPAVAQSAPEISQDMADPEDGVSYASISYTKKANSKAKIRSKKDDDDTVTYSTVKASSPDPSSLYATIYNPNSGP
ncbi:uncharacterized protein LOC111575082 [Amphiprion ocellaris]|uniref:uncharacterized protein LOC111575082 n=1 Tax=Amphiprion ocellaris TaxID=80972 RepID=UPI002410BB2F|nr:uncharacterized protein LOC111575082 [Amphiprion ocellaris]